MSAIGFVLFALWLLAAAVSYACIRDIFSPDKLALAALGVFFADIFFSHYPATVQFAYALLLLALASTVIVLSPLVRRAAAEPLALPPPSRTQPNSFSAAVSPVFFWVISMPALAAQVAMIANFGGIEGYIGVLAMRVIEFQGLGWLSAIIQTYSIVDLLYFSFLVTRRHVAPLAIAVYCVHLLLFVVIALLTGSRGSLLVNFVLMVLVHHLLVRRATLRRLVVVAVSALVVASVLEVAREGVAIGDEGLVTGLSESREAESSVGFAWATYGTMPLALVLDAPSVNLHYGFTYLTWVTNAIPRALWPEKPDSGGVVLTKEYTGDAWDGASHLSTGLLPEAMINFGQAAGLFVGVLQFVLIQTFLVILYVRYKRRLALHGPYDFVYGVRFAYISWAMMGLIVGEFTNIMLTLTVQLVTVWLLFAAIRWPGLTSQPRTAAGGR